MLYKSFCDIISTAVENRILSWHGRNDITLTQASKLIQNGYMLGGFIVDVDSSSIIMPTLLSMLLISNNGPRISDQQFRRDTESLYRFYQNYEEDFESCKNVNELDNLQSVMAQDLYERSMTAIRLTCEFGG